MLKNFKLTIEYDGSAYCGWQRQPNGPTIQQTIEMALQTMTRQPVTLIGSGRTDAGVHAIGQVAHFKCDTTIAAQAFQKGLNSLLPNDIVIRESTEWIRAPLDVEAMTTAAAYLIGLKDFKSFEGTGSPRAHTVRHVIRAEVQKPSEDRIVFEIQAEGFLRYMVRNIVGTLTAVGTGALPPEALQAILLARDRNKAAATAPPQGLCLRHVYY
jgi:tRNA pseudouridine38-40 synthase